MEREVSENSEKATMLWKSFRDRLGVSIDTVIPWEIMNMVQTAQNLLYLSAHFTTKEIDKVVASLPIDKASELEGFDGQFLKSSWHIIKSKFYKLCKDFQDGLISLDAISRKYINLNQLSRLHEEIDVILCELEIYFTPAIFDIMVPLLVHILDDINHLGPNSCTT
jgi:hypothetical protein